MKSKISSKSIEWMTKKNESKVERESDKEKREHQHRIRKGFQAEINAVFRRDRKGKRRGAGEETGIIIGLCLVCVCREGNERSCPRDPLKSISCDCGGSGGGGCAP